MYILQQLHKHLQLKKQIAFQQQALAQQQGLHCSWIEFGTVLLQAQCFLFFMLQAKTFSKPRTTEYLKLCHT